MKKMRCYYGNSLLQLAVFLFFSMSAYAQRHEILNNRIASLQVVAGNDWLSPPVIKLYGGDVMNISFDDLTHEYHRYAYRIEHCEADWTTSEELFESDYVDGFYDGNIIDDVEESVNTTVLYTHYSFQIPNDKCRLKMSGNYRVTVYDENNNDEEVLKACFMVVEPQMSVGLNVVTNTDMDINGRHQQVEMEIDYGTINVINPLQQVKTVIMQNGRWDNAVINSKPQYVMNNGLRWSHCKNLVFLAGNEYRKFEMLDVTHTTFGLERMGWDGSNYHAYVWTDEPCPNYLYDEDANGAFYIRNSDNIENDIISDYVNVHFRLKTYPVRGSIYLNGAWTNDRFLHKYAMKYNEETGLYEATVLLKQGYYSYQYLLVTPEGTITPLPSEGSFFQTENAYQALVYYRGTGGRTDRLVGYTQTHSR